VAEEKKNGNIDYLCSISSTDFEHVRNGFLDSKIEEKENAIRKSRDNSNRIARFVVNLMVFLTFISLMVGLEIFIESFIPYHDGKTYIVIFVLMTIVCLSALCYSFTDRAWIARRSKWIGENLHVKKMKWTDGVTLYVADNDNNPTYFMYYQEKHLFFYYHTIEFPITKEVQLLPVQMMKKSLVLLKKTLPKFSARLNMKVKTLLSSAKVWKTTWQLLLLWLPCRRLPRQRVE
jgi:hypothetical protein